LNGTLYYIDCDPQNSNIINFREVTFDGNTASTDNITASMEIMDADRMTIMLHNGVTGYPNPVLKSEDGTFSWGAAKLCTFNPVAGTITSADRPEHYPNGQGAFVDGIAYVMDNFDYEVTGDAPGSVFTNSLPQKIWICDMSKSEAEPLVIDWSNLDDYEKTVARYDELHWRYWPGIQCFSAHGRCSDGIFINYNIPVSGENKGVAKVVGYGNGVRILSAIRLK